MSFIGQRRRILRITSIVFALVTAPDAVAVSLHLMPDFRDFRLQILTSAKGGSTFWTSPTSTLGFQVHSTYTTTLSHKRGYKHVLVAQNLKLSIASKWKSGQKRLPYQCCMSSYQDTFLNNMCFLQHIRNRHALSIYG